MLDKEEVVRSTLTREDVAKMLEACDDVAMAGSPARDSLEQTGTGILLAAGAERSDAESLG